MPHLTIPPNAVSVELRGDRDSYNSSSIQASRTVLEEAIQAVEQTGRDPPQLLSSTREAEPDQDVDAETDVKYQHIMYRLQSGSRNVPETPIDLVTALHEMDSLTYKTWNFMSLDNKNRHTDGFLQFIRKALDYWSLDIPIDMGANWNGYVWKRYTNTETLVEIIRLFFNEDPWFNESEWKMTRDMRYVDDRYCTSAQN